MVFSDFPKTISMNSRLIGIFHGPGQHWSIDDRAQLAKSLQARILADVQSATHATKEAQIAEKFGASKSKLRVPARVQLH